jgi:hypothetical protein
MRPKSKPEPAGGVPARRQRLHPPRGCMVQLYLSVEERDLLRRGAAAVGLTAGGFAARAALDAAVVATVPVGARTELEWLAGLQLELAATRRQVNLLRAELASPAGGNPPVVGQVAKLERRCEQVAGQLTRLATAVHQRLGRGR